MIYNTEFNDDEYGDFEPYDDDAHRLDGDRREKIYTVLKEKDICKLQEEDITKTSSTLLIPRVMLVTQDALYADEDKVRKDLGLQEVVPIQNTENIVMCTICFDEFLRDGMCADTCGHLFGNLCWTQYVSIKISDGPGCLGLQCPEPSCRVVVGQDMVNELVSDEDKEKYSRYLVRSYVEDQKNIKWFPSPDWEFSVEFVAGSSSFDVVCGSDHSFCWNCLDDAHRPVDCDTVHKWAVKNTAESENVTWILVNSKSFPKCKKPIQKNEGCTHMRCHCKFDFCWLCLVDWKTHGDKTGGFYAFNIYEKAKADGRYKEEEKLKKKAQDYLDRYTFYYERYAENLKSRLKAVESLQKMQSEDFAKLSYRYSLTDMNLQVITDGWLQIINCRRILKWAYAYRYYLPQSERVKAQYFDGSQGETEYWLEMLHQCAEQELQAYLTDENAPENFMCFDIKLTGLTRATRNYFDNLVLAIENDLSEVNSG
ncbi:hypothetical protein MKX03_001692 [Papaver bracteatum]|nr:hypothetical protein MKX03_001692 [Papaver bracteatum]